MMRHITEVSVNLLISLSNKIVSSGLKEMVTVASSEMEGDATPEPSECVVELSLFIFVFLSPTDRSLITSFNARRVNLCWEQLPLELIL